MWPQRQRACPSGGAGGHRPGEYCKQFHNLRAACGMPRDLRVDVHSNPFGLCALEQRMDELQLRVGHGHGKLKRRSRVSRQPSEAWYSIRRRGKPMHSPRRRRRRWTRILRMRLSVCLRLHLRSGELRLSPAEWHGSLRLCDMQRGERTGAVRPRRWEQRHLLRGGLHEHRLRDRRKQLRRLRMFVRRGRRAREVCAARPAT